MSRLTVSSIFAAALTVAQVGSAGTTPAEPTQPAPLDEAGMAGAIESTLGTLFQRTSPAVVRVESTDELGKVAGTGFFIDDGGLIYTLASVVGDGLDLTVMHEGRKLPARLLAKDTRSGVALVKVEDVSPQFLIKGDCCALKPASPVVVVGFPFDHEAAPSFGVVGGFDRQSKGRFFATTHIRANVPVQRGQGGSPVVNLAGQVVGIVVSGFEDGTGCYVLPIRAAEKVRIDHAKFGEVRHGWAGVTVQQLPGQVHGSSIAIDMVDPAGPAASEFRPGDVILQVGDITIREPEDALDASFFLTEGEPVTVRIARGGEVLTVPITPGRHPLERKGNLHALGTAGLEAPAESSAP